MNEIAIPLLDLEDKDRNKTYHRSKDPRIITFPDKNTQKYEPNVIRNQKYSIFSFLPLVLYEQFKFFFNLYFLLNAFTQLLPTLRVGYLFTYFGPLSFVLAVTIFKEGYDDYKRYLRDLEANSQVYEKLTRNGTILRLFNNKGFVWVPSSQITVGDYIRIHKNGRIPADCLLMRSSDPESVFIRTGKKMGTVIEVLIMVLIIY
jgi:phospholipid-translocating ATPase